MSPCYIKNIVIAVVCLDLVVGGAAISPLLDVKRSPLPLEVAAAKGQQEKDQSQNSSTLIPAMDRFRNHSSFVNGSASLPFSSRPTKLPRKSVVGAGPLASSYYTSSAWINTIKSIAVCWAIVACIWIFFKLLTCSTFAYRLWYRKRLTEAREMALLEGAQSGVPSGGCPLGLGFASRWTQVNFLKQGGEAAMEAPPGYEQFSPPAYEDIVGMEMCAQLILERVDETVGGGGTAGNASDEGETTALTADAQDDRS
ncbi:uncharacterized protein LOC129593351 [Paramacrobiotus metropolitanus]|uniref:uncharacterized protein LOC129593351 n=1 Tax=Paramacrobiotus metropolitanus TaxID=2943436 RepID=UPI002445851F|nr:uncharacterized protein LOC129593351 [Paramacrobiotus metropolitanus]